MLIIIIVVIIFHAFRFFWGRQSPQLGSSCSPHSLGSPAGARLPPQTLPHLLFPALDLAGAAAATVVARLAEGAARGLPRPSSPLINSIKLQPLNDV